jgi:hypothetical protein
MALFGLGRLPEARHEFDTMAASPQQAEQVIGGYANRLLIYEGSRLPAAPSINPVPLGSTLQQHIPNA